MSRAPLPSRHPDVIPPMGADRDKAFAILAIAPTFLAANVVDAFKTYGDQLNINALHDVLVDRCKQVRDGDLREVEFTLAAQARSLDAIYGSLAWRAGVNSAKHPEYAVTMLKLALKAQGQCRATLETLAALKRPATVIAQQANIAHGPQQVNIGAMPAVAAGAIAPNELLEGGSHGEGERLAPGAARAAGAGDPAMATVAVLDRTAQRRRQGRRQP